ncbi:MAG: CBS domain-containing protein [Phycisphaerales bacterium]|jgi:HD-GYP domain-containing protein (c-di-GMP phosphodiesterase class II)|nr:CBS domain-containing protein [Phycisphaerales bacterium]
MMTFAKELLDVSGRTRELITAMPGDTIVSAAKTIRDNHIGCMVVIGDDKRVVGIISERDIVVRVTAEVNDPSKTLVGDVMTTPVVSCAPTTPLDDVRELMRQYHIRHVAVLEDGMPVGIVSSREIFARRLADDQQVRNLTVFSLARLAEMRDTDTGAHLERVREYACILADQLRLQDKYAGLIDDSFINLLYVTSPLHDIGKVSIPDAVLLKPGRLTEVEYDVMKTHASAGAEALGEALAEFPNADFLQMAKDIAGCHHERIDGLGYPFGMRGDEIPLSARIFALVDVYDALVTKRVYKEAFTPITAKNIIIEGSGTQFDSDVVDAFLACEEDFLETYRSHSRPATVVKPAPALVFAAVGGGQ